jgi:hypothetical protein
MVVDGAIMAEERARMTLGTYPRQKRELLAPFEHQGCFQDLAVEACEMFTLPDAAWNEYERDGNKEAFATKHVLFFRSIFVPSLASALDRVRSGDADALRMFGDQVEARLKRRIVSQPKAMQSFTQAIVLAKQT